MDKAPLMVFSRPGEPSALIQHRQQHQPDAGLRGRFDHGPGHFRAATAIDTMMQIMEFRHAGIARAQHVRKGPGRDRQQLLRDLA